MGDNDNLDERTRRWAARAALETWELIYQSLYKDEHWTIEAVRARKGIQWKREDLFKRGLL